MTNHTNIPTDRLTPEAREWFMQTRPHELADAERDPVLGNAMWWAAAGRVAVVVPTR